MSGRKLSACLWVAQCLVGIPFVIFGFMKLTSPIASLSAAMPWTGQLPVALVRSTALIDMLGGIGILLPALTRILPRLTVWAAAGCVALQLCAITFHVSRGEAGMTPLNLIFLGLSAFVFWGRSRARLIAPR